MSAPESGFDCPQCGAFVRRGRASCPECGSDERTGWQEADEIDYQSLELPDEPAAPAPRSTVHRIVLVLVVVALVLALLLAM